MSKTVTPAPYGSAGLAFGNTTKAPYSKARPHAGTDHQWRWLLPIRSKQTVAPIGGKVIAAFNDGRNHNGWGNYVDILVPSMTHRIVVRLAHHATGSVVVRVGDTVRSGDPVGTMGSTGETNGVHLHEELWINGVRVDPIYYRTHDLPGTVGGSPAGGTSGGTPTTSTGTTPSKPAVTSEEEDEYMRIIAIAGKPAKYLAIPGIGTVQISNTDDLALINRYIAGKEMEFNEVQRARMSAYLRGQTPVV